MDNKHAHWRPKLRCQGTLWVYLARPWRSLKYTQEHNNYKAGVQFRKPLLFLYPSICCVSPFWAKSYTYCKNVQLHFCQTEFNIPFVLCGNEDELFNNTFGMLQSLDERLIVTFLVNVTLFLPFLTYHILCFFTIRKFLKAVQFLKFSIDKISQYGIKIYII